MRGAPRLAIRLCACDCMPLVHTTPLAEFVQRGATLTEGALLPALLPVREIRPQQIKARCALFDKPFNGGRCKD